MHACVFTARSLADVAGARGTPDEVIDVAWFDADNLPDITMWWHAERIGDAIRGRRGAVVSQHISSRLGRLEVPALYEARDDSGQKRSEFFRNTFPAPS